MSERLSDEHIEARAAALGVSVDDLLRWGENLLVATEGLGGSIYLRGQLLHYSDDYELLAALRTEADRG